MIGRLLHILEYKTLDILNPNNSGLQSSSHAHHALTCLTLWRACCHVAVSYGATTDRKISLPSPKMWTHHPARGPDMNEQTEGVGVGWTA